MNAAAFILIIFIKNQLNYLSINKVKRFIYIKFIYVYLVLTKAQISNPSIKYRKSYITDNVKKLLKIKKQIETDKEKAIRI
jgi:hypothetical protein